MTSQSGGTKLVTIATQTTDTVVWEPFISGADLSAIAAAESLYDDNLSAFYHGSWPINDSGRSRPGQSVNENFYSLSA